MDKKEKAIRNVKVTETTLKKLKDYRIVDGETLNSVVKRLLEKGGNNENKNKDRLE